MWEYIRNMYSMDSITDAEVSPSDISLIHRYVSSLFSYGINNESRNPDVSQLWIKQALKILQIDPMIDENGTNHRTRQYDHMKNRNNNMLFIRRGQTFHLTLFVDRDFSPEKDGVSLVFQLADPTLLSTYLPLGRLVTIKPALIASYNPEEEGCFVGGTLLLSIGSHHPQHRFGEDNCHAQNVRICGISSSATNSLLISIERPGIGAGTEIVVPVGHVRADQLYNIWYAWVVRSGEKTMEIGVFPSSKCIVGEWNMRVDTKLQTQRQGDSYDFPGTVVILFNPWSEYDQVYMEEEELRQAYILHDYGYLYRGSYHSFSSTPWIFGQFQKDVTSCALMLISSLKPVAPALRNDALQVARRLSAILHNGNGAGVLYGQWDEDRMHDGRHPSSWTGSPEILIEFYRTRNAVKYGQCANFSAIFTTVCRAIGIPCRSITNFASAHPEEKMKVHIILDESGRQVGTKGHIWNYHAWNEMWVKRPDVSDSDRKYDGWNAIDATPQESSDGVLQCGPTSVKAVKLGDVLKHFDTRIGKLIVTQAIGSSRAISITDSYKFYEGSREERETYHAAVRLIENVRPRSFRYVTNGRFQWLKCKLVMPQSSQLGSPLQVKLKVRNKSKEKLTVKVSMNLSIQSYNGEQLRNIKTLEKHSIEIDSKQEYEQLVEASFDEYGKLILSEDDVLHASYLASVPDKDYDLGGVDTAEIDKTQLQVTINLPADRELMQLRAAELNEELDTELVKESSLSLKKGTKKNKLTVTATFKNPLPVKLTGGVFKFVSPQSTVIEVKTNRDVEPNEEFSQSTIWEDPGRDVPLFLVLAHFSCNEIKCIRGFFQSQQENLYET